MQSESVRQERLQTEFLRLIAAIPMPNMPICLSLVLHRNACVRDPPGQVRVEIFSISLGNERSIRREPRGVSRVPAANLLLRVVEENQTGLNLSDWRSERHHNHFDVASTMQDPKTIFLVHRDEDVISHRTPTSLARPRLPGQSPTSSGKRESIPNRSEKWLSRNTRRDPDAGPQP